MLDLAVREKIRRYQALMAALVHSLWIRCCKRHSKHFRRQDIPDIKERDKWAERVSQGLCGRCEEPFKEGNPNFGGGMCRSVGLYRIEGLICIV